MLCPGQSCSFAVKAWDRQGNKVELAVEWQSSGGEIQPSGVFTAGERVSQGELVHFGQRYLLRFPKPTQEQFRLGFLRGYPEREGISAFERIWQAIERE